MSKENNRPKGENSPYLVILVMRQISFYRGSLFEYSYRCGPPSGRQDWAFFRQMVDCFLWAGLLSHRSNPNFGLHFGRFFHKTNLVTLATFYIDASWLFKSDLCLFRCVSSRVT
jgi:hypothetical protein